MKPGSLNLLEPSGPHRTSYGTALPLCFKQSRAKNNFFYLHRERFIKKTDNKDAENATLLNSVHNIHLQEQISWWCSTELVSNDAVN